MSLPAYSNYIIQRNNINNDTSDIVHGIVSQTSDPFCLCISDSTGKNLWVVEVNSSALRNNDVIIHGPAFHFVFENGGVSASSFVAAISLFSDYDVNSAISDFGNNLFKSLMKIEVYGAMHGSSPDGYLTLANILKNNTLNSADDYEIVALQQLKCLHTGALVALIMSKYYGFLTYDKNRSSCIAGDFSKLENTNA